MGPATMTSTTFPSSVRKDRSSACGTRTVADSRRCREDRSGPGRRSEQVTRRRIVHAKPPPTPEETAPRRTRRRWTIALAIVLLIPLVAFVCFEAHDGSLVRRAKLLGDEIEKGD